MAAGHHHCPGDAVAPIHEERAQGSIDLAGSLAGEARREHADQLHHGIGVGQRRQGAAGGPDPPVVAPRVRRQGGARKAHQRANFLQMTARFVDVLMRFVCRRLGLQLLGRELELACREAADFLCDPLIWFYGEGHGILLSAWRSDRHAVRGRQRT